MHRGGSKVCHSNLFTIRLDKKTANEHLLNFLAFFGILNLKKTNPPKIRDKMLSKWKYWTLLSVSYWLNIMSQLSAPICLCHAILRPCSRKRWPQTRYPCVLRKTWNFDLSLTWGGKRRRRRFYIRPLISGNWHINNSKTSFDSSIANLTSSQVKGEQASRCEEK